MSLYRRAAKRDACEREIFDAFKAAGCAVLPLSVKGGPDAVVCCPHTGIHLVEVKGKRGRFTEAQQKWRASWTGPQPHTIRDVQDALKLAGGK